MSKPGYTGPLEQIDECCWRIPKSYKLGMQVEGRIFADDRLIAQIRGDQAPEQVANVAFLPGIQMASLAMPDIHWGYGFCIGGVSATDPAEGGVISPGGVGYDINCGVRLMRTNLKREDVQPRLNQLMDALFRQIPAGVGKGGPYLFGGRELRRLLADGAPYLATRGWATSGDLEHTEAGGCLPGAEPDSVSDRALKRGGDQCGTLGSGNHFLEIQVVDEIHDENAARTMGLEKDGVCVMIHSGSRGLGYQVCDDALLALRKAPAKYGIELPDRQLACAPSTARRARNISGRCAAAANYAWANRQLLMWQTREVFADFFGQSWESLQMNLIYDVAHNIAKMEEHDGRGAAKAGVRASQGGHAGLPRRTPRSARTIPPDRPAGNYPRRHGPGKLGARGPAGQHGTDLRHHLPRRRPGDESHSGRPARPGPADRPRIGRKGDHRQVPKLEGAGRGAAGRLQGRKSRGQRSPPRRAGQQGGPIAACGGGEGIAVIVVSAWCGTLVAKIESSLVPMMPITCQIGNKLLI